MKVNNTTNQAVSSVEMPTYEVEQSLGAKLLRKLGIQSASTKMTERKVIVKKEGDAADCVACCMGTDAAAALGAPLYVNYPPVHHYTNYYHRTRW